MIDFSELIQQIKSAIKNRTPVCSMTCENVWGKEVRIPYLYNGRLKSRIKTLEPYTLSLEFDTNFTPQKIIECTLQSIEEFEKRCCKDLSNPICYQFSDWNFIESKVGPQITLNRSSMKYVFTLMKYAVFTEQEPIIDDSINCIDCDACNADGYCCASTCIDRKVKDALISFADKLKDKFKMYGASIIDATLEEFMK